MTVRQQRRKSGVLELSPACWVSMNMLLSHGASQRAKVTIRSMIQRSNAMNTIASARCPNRTMRAQRNRAARLAASPWPAGGSAKQRNSHTDEPAPPLA